MGGAKLVVATAPSTKVVNGLINGIAVDGTLLILAVMDSPLELPSRECSRAAVSPVAMRAPQGDECESDGITVYPRSCLPVPMIQKRLSVRGWPAGAPQDSEDTLAFADLHGGELKQSPFSTRDVEEDLTCHR